MVLNIYSIKDELANSFGNLMVINEQVAKRTFKWIMQEQESKDCEDKRIYYMGKYDTSNGAISAVMPEMVYNLEQERKAYEESERTKNG